MQKNLPETLAHSYVAEIPVVRKRSMFESHGEASAVHRFYIQTNRDVDVHYLQNYINALAKVDDSTGRSLEELIRHRAPEYRPNGAISVVSQEKSDPKIIPHENKICLIIPE